MANIVVDGTIGANRLLILDSTGKIPAVDGSQVTTIQLVVLLLVRFQLLVLILVQLPIKLWYLMEVEDCLLLVEL